MQPPDELDELLTEEDFQTSNNGFHPAKKTSWTVAELLDTEFPEPRWAIPDLIPEGLTILGGRPKVGKSWLALQACHSVSTGGIFFDRRVEHGQALFLAFEDNGRRMKQRLLTQKIDRSAGIRFEFSWRPLNKGGLDDLLIALEAGIYRLIVIDTIERACPGIDKGKEEAIGPIFDQLQRLAISRNTAILVVDHLRKSNGFSADPIDDIIGSTAKTGTADAILALYKEQGKAGAILRGRGRDIEDIDLQLSWHFPTCSWQSDGNATELELTEQRSEIIEALEMLGKSQLNDIAGAIGKDRSNTYKRLCDLFNAGKIKREKIDNRVYWEA